MICGHEETVARLESRLPPALLLIGPQSVGKWLIAKQLLRKHEFLPSDVLESRAPSVEKVREIARFASRRPFGSRKAVLLELDRDGTLISQAAQNALLKLLEEPPGALYYILVSSAAPLPTIMSRCTIERFGLLQQEQVERVLMSKFGMSQSDAAVGGMLSGGRMQEALQAGDIMTAKAPVLSLLKGASEGDETLFYASLQRWSRNEQRLLELWAVELRTARWRIFSPAESYGLVKSPEVAERVLRVRTLGCRPRIAAKLALMDVMEARR